MTKRGLRRKPRPKDIRARVLKNMGLDPLRPGLQISTKQPRRPKDKTTWAMIALEERYGMSIHEILNYGSLEEVSQRFGISRTSAWNWRERLGLNDGKHLHEHLPPKSIAELEEELSEVGPDGGN